VIAPAQLKVELAMRGLRLDESVRLKRDAVAGEPAVLDLRLPDRICVTAPIDDHRAAASPFRLVAEGGRHVLVRGGNGGDEGLRIEVRAIEAPHFYARRTTSGTPMRRIAAVRGGHLIVSPSSACGFSVQGTPCRFCLEGARTRLERDAATPAEVVEVVRAALEEGIDGAVYFNTGSFESDDGGIAFLAPYVEAVRRHFDVLVAAQVHPPASLGWVDRTYAMGVDALSYNLEVWNAEILRRRCVGRAHYIGRERYLEALARAAEIFPNGTVWSDLVIGIEPTESTLAGIDALAALRVVPVVALCAGQEPPDESVIPPVLAHLSGAVRRQNIHIGWVRDLARGISPLEAQQFSDRRGGAGLMWSLTRWRLGALAARNLARFRRRLRVRPATEAAATHD
jgi:hypothetical protein